MAEPKPDGGASFPDHADPGHADPGHAKSGHAKSGHAKSGSPNRLPHLIPLYLGFAATGIGVALPGAILPLLLKRWQLHDEGGGRLLLGSFIGSSVGALLVSGSRRRSLAIGSAAIGLAAAGFTIAPAPLRLLSMTLFGMGLGMTMTSISLIRQRQASNGSAEMVRLNLLWSIGAFICPALALPALRSGDLRPVFLSLALLFLLLSAWTLAQPRGCFEGGPAPNTEGGSVPDTKLGGMAPNEVRSPGFHNYFQRLPLRLVLLVMLTVGVEASFGGWLSTYAQRQGDPFSQVIAAPTCFWAGLLLSRLFWSIYSPVIPERWVVRGSLLMIAFSGVLLLDLRRGLPFLLAALCIGFGVGPTYPLLLAQALRVRASGTIFFLCGVSSAFLPWLTGFVSTQSGSLGTGLLVPVLAAVLMVAMAFTRALPASKPAT